MSILDQWGFEWGVDQQEGMGREGLVSTVNAWEWELVTDLGPQTGSSVYAARSSNNATAAAELPLENTPSGSQFWIHWQWVMGNNPSIDNYVSWNQGGTKIGEVRLNNGRIEVNIPGTGISTSTEHIGLFRWRRLHVFVDLQVTGTGTIEVYFDGQLSTPVFSVTSTVTNPSSLSVDRLGIGVAGGNFTAIDDIAVMDPLDATGITDPQDIAFYSIGPKQPNGDGFYSAWTAAGTPGGAADYEHIDESPPVDTDYIEATATSQASTFTFEPATTGFVVLAAKWKGRFLRSDTVAGANMNIRQRDVSAATDFDTADIAVPGDGYIYSTFDQRPGGGAWTNADWNDTEWGVVSKT